MNCKVKQRIRGMILLELDLMAEFADEKLPNCFEGDDTPRSKLEQAIYWLDGARPAIGDVAAPIIKLRHILNNDFYKSPKYREYTLRMIELISKIQLFWRNLEQHHPDMSIDFGFGCTGAVVTD